MGEHQQEATTGAEAPEASRPHLVSIIDPGIQGGGAGRSTRAERTTRIPSLGFARARYRNRVWVEAAATYTAKLTDTVELSCVHRTAWSGRRWWRRGVLQTMPTLRQPLPSLPACHHASHCCVQTGRSALDRSISLL